MQPTPEQQAIIDYIAEHDELVKVNSVAGSGKTSLLVHIASHLNAENGLYLAYNKAIATEAQGKFTNTVHCCTTHSLAYGPTVREHKLSVGFFSYRTITERISYDAKLELIAHIRAFCLSAYLDFETYAEESGISPKLINLGITYLSKMQSGEIECTHEFYLKYFHILLATREITYDEFDFIALDEAGDLNPVTLEIFMLLPSSKKLMVGDPYQNIYSFNHTINCFEVTADVGKTFFMTKSFRVSDRIASTIQAFCNKYLDPDMKFQGIPTPLEAPITTRAYIARTNSTLINRMIELNRQAIPYGLTRTAKQIFQLPLIICSLKYKGFISLPEYKHIQTDVDDYYSKQDIRSKHKSLLAYVKACHEDDLVLQGVINLVLKHGPKTIIECSQEARKHESTRYAKLILGTAHSMKGLEVDEVELADDLNKTASIAAMAVQLGKDIEDLSTEERSELNLYYVACTRARVSLLNAKLLPQVKPDRTANPFD